MDAKHQFKYTYNGGCEDFSPVEVTFNIPGDSSLNQMLYNFQSYLKACGFVFDGELEIVDHTFDVMKDQDDIDEIYGCMADWDKDVLDESEDCCEDECGCSTTSSPLENSKDSKWNKAEKMLKEWNEGIARLDNEQKQKCREESLKMSDLHYEATKDIISDKINFKDCCTDNLGIRKEPKMWDKIAETVKQKWVHGMCNPPSPDWKKKK